MSEETTQSAEEALPKVEVSTKTEDDAQNVETENNGGVKKEETAEEPTKISAGPAPKSQFIRLRGLPYSAAEKDIQQFFDGLEIERVKFMCSSGRPNGEAYVEFKSTEDAGKAMEFDRKEMNSRYIEVFSVAADEAEFSMRPDPESNGSESHVVRLRGIPWSCKESDIRQFFEGLEPSPEEIVIGGTGGPRSRPSGEAFVRFTTREAAEQAMEYNNKHMGSRYVEVFLSSMVELNRAKGGGSSAGTHERTGIRPLMSIDRSDSGYGHDSRAYGSSYGSGGYGGYDDYGGRGGYGAGGYGGSSEYGYSGYDQRGYGDHGRGGGGQASNDPLRIYMRGLPYDADHHAIEAFFSPIRVHSIKLGVNESGRPSGDAIAEFDSYNDLQAGLSKNNQRMGRRYVELFDTRGAPSPMRRLLWRDATGPNASSAPQPDPYLNGGAKRSGPPAPSRDTGYRAVPQAMPPAPRDPYGPRAPPAGRERYERYEREPRAVPPRGAAPPGRAPPPPHGRAPDPWGSYGASAAASSYETSASGWEAYGYTVPSSAYPHDASYGASAAAYPPADRQRESRDSQWGQAPQGSYGGWGTGDHRGGY